MKDLIEAIYSLSHNISSIIDSCTGEIQGRLAEIAETVRGVSDEIGETKEYLSDIGEAIRELKKVE